MDLFYALAHFFQWHQSPTTLSIQLTMFCSLNRRLHLIKFICLKNIIVTCYEVERLLQTLKNTAPGVDSLPCWLFQYCSYELAEPIAHIYIYIIIKTKLESVSLSCKSYRSKRANITILFANSKHQSKLPHLYQSQAYHKCA